MSDLSLSKEHLETLKTGSAISEDMITARGYRTITDKNELTALGFAPAQCRVPGLLLPLHTTDGEQPISVYRPDNPRVIELRRSGKNPDGTYPNKVIKYEFPKGAEVRIDCPPTSQPMLSNPEIPLWITEGQKKADALASLGLCAIALLGVWNWRGKNPLGGSTILSDFDHIAFDKRDVRVVFDSDVMTKPDVRKALNRLTDNLHWKSAKVSHVYLPQGDPEGKTGVDDYLAKGKTLEDLEALIEAPRPELKAAAPTVKLLEEPPLRMTRPLALLGGRSYAASWLWTEKTVTEITNKKGEVIRLSEPEITKSRDLFIIRGDGKIFAEAGGDQSLKDAGVDVHLGSSQTDEKTWSTKGVVRYKHGERPDPVDVFSRVADVVDNFIDFDRSLGCQRTMAEMTALYCLGTWFLDAFNVVGYLWPNGDRGSGKTQFLMVVSELSYLGQVILAGGSYASLRDLADYGATLCFDDAENIADPQKVDPDKRALLLAGNRRGNTVTVKELDSSKKWVNRNVNSFAPRLFSAIRIPDPVLASRTIIIPLVRSPNRKKANAVIQEVEDWPHNKRQLLDDLWALGLSKLPDLAKYERLVNQRAQLEGRNLEPWRLILGVALWLDETGGERVSRDGQSLWERIHNLSISYQSERPDLETSDITVLVIRAMLQIAANQTDLAKGDGKSPPEVFSLSVKQVTETVKQIVSLDEDDDEADTTYYSNRRVGRVLTRQRLRQAPRVGGKGSRTYLVNLSEIRQLAQVYGVSLPEPLLGECAISDFDNGTNGTNGNGHNGTETDDLPWFEVPEGAGELDF